MYSELFRPAFLRPRTEYGEVPRAPPHSARMWENTDQNNSEYGRPPRSGRDQSSPPTQRRPPPALTALYLKNIREKLTQKSSEKRGKDQKLVYITEMLGAYASTQPVTQNAHYICARKSLRIYFKTFHTKTYLT